MLSTCWLLYLRSAVWLIRNHLNLVEVRGMEARSSDAALHHSPSWSNSPYTAWKCVGPLSCWKTNDSPTKRKPDGMAYRCRMLWLPCWLSVPCILNKSLLLSPAKHPHTIRLPLPFFTVKTTHADIIYSPTLHLTKTTRLEPKISNLDSSDQRTDFHWSNVHSSCCLAQASPLFLLVAFSTGFFAAIQPWRPDSRSLIWTVDVEMCLLLELWIIYLGCNF